MSAPCDSALTNASNTSEAEEADEDASMALEETKGVASALDEALNKPASSAPAPGAKDEPANVDKEGGELPEVRPHHQHCYKAGFAQPLVYVGW